MAPWGSPGTTLGALGRPEASPKPTREATGAPKSIQNRSREQKKEIFSKRDFLSALPMRGALRTPPKSSKIIQNRLLGPLGRPSRLTLDARERLARDSGGKKGAPNDRLGVDSYFR